MAELAGVMVGNYFLLERLRSEGMVETYLARPTTHGGYDVYLRLFRPRFPDPQAFQKHFSSEVRKVWRCQHENIQALTAFGEGDGVLYTAARAEEAPTLEQALTKLGSTQLPVSQVAKLIAQLCEALQYAHERDIVHGNLQPSSILLVSSHQAQLTNFGLRRAYQEGDPTLASVEDGNAAYLAPEQVVGMLCPASDIYALGILLYRLLGGVLPYNGESAGEIAMAHANEPLPSLCALRPDLPESVDMVVRMALAKNPKARFSTPHDLAAALIQALARNKAPTDVRAPARRIAVHPRRTRLTWSRALSLLAITFILLGLSSTFYLFSFSGLPFQTMSHLPLPVAQAPGSSSLFFPPLGSAAGYPTPGQPTPTPAPSTGAVATRPVVGHQPSPTPTPGGDDGSTPVTAPSSTPGIQLSPIVFPVTPTVPPVSSPGTTPLTCAPGSLSINGSFYLAPLLQQIGSDYQTFCSGVTLHIGAQGCQAGLKALENGQTDLAASDLSVSATQKFTDYPLLAFLYAVVVSPDVQISGLSSQQLQAIYQGQITNWSQVGGPDEVISPLLHPSSDPLNAIFQAFVLNAPVSHMRGIKLSKNVTPEQVVQKVAQTPGSITYVSLAVSNAANVRVLALNRAQPTLQNVLQGSYPFWSVEHLYASTSADAQAQAYMQFLLSLPESNRLAQSDALPLSAFAPVVLASHVPGPFIGA